MLILLLLFGESQLRFPFLWQLGNNIVCVALFFHSKLLLVVFGVVDLYCMMRSVCYL